MRRTLLPVSLSALVAMACASATPEAGDGSRDSAGIEIVENTAPRWSDAEAWRLSDAPLLTMGGTEGDSTHEFFRITGATRLSDGTIVVANGGTNQLRYFAPDGSLIRTVGRKGGGPGEFQALAGIFRTPDDGLVTYDLMNRRLSVFDSRGRHVRDLPVAGLGPFSFLQMAGRFSDGTYLAYLQTGMGPAMLNRPLGPARDSIQVFRLDTSAAIADTLGVFPSVRSVVHNLELMGRSVPMPIPVPYSPGTIVESGSRMAYIGTSDTYQVTAMDPDGTVRRLIRKAQPPRPVTDADKQRHRATLDRMARQQPNVPGMAAMRDAMAGMAFPDVMPAFSLLVVDAGDHLWVADFATDDQAPARWSVFDPQGAWLGTVETPPGLRVREIGDDYVIGQLQDELEVERIALYRLIKPGD